MRKIDLLSLIDIFTLKEVGEYEVKKNTKIAQI